MTVIPREQRGAGLGRVLAYYLVLATVIVALSRAFPTLRDMFAIGSAEFLGEGAGSGSGSLPAASQIPAHLYGPGIAGIAMLGALALMIPVTWVYMITHRFRGYQESVVHTLLILPVTVTGIVVIVQNSVALAFSLAGIVAAVRFRTTLEDTKDAVYVFLAIGVGIASGVRALGIALALSLMFNAVVLFIWRTRFGNLYVDRQRAMGSLPLADVLAGPGAASRALRVGDPALLEAASATDLRHAADHASRVERHIAAERAKARRKRANTLLIVHTSRAEAAQRVVEEALEEVAERWKLVEISPAPGSGATLLYLARLDGPAVQGALADRLREARERGPEAVELVSLKGLKTRG